jgi:hypothetical protein
VKAQLLQIDSDAYHSNSFSATPCYSNSIGKIIINKSPLHAWMAHPMLNPEYVSEEKTAFDLGSAAHAALLEGMDICQVLDFPDYRTNEAKEQRDAARKAGKIPMLKKDYPALAKMVKVAQESIRRCPDLGGLRLSDGKPEQTIHLVEGDTHIKMRLDWLSNNADVILDYKTTDIASPDSWMRSLHSAGHDMQSALYPKGVEILTGKEPLFVFMVQETSEPYSVYFIGMTGEYQHHGMRKTETALQMWQDCMRTGIWPGYSNRIMYPELPAYVEGAWMEKDAMRNEERKQAGVGPVSKEAFLFGKVR